jgi:tetratricopeptide (TPR) repeat protein
VSPVPLAWLHTQQGIAWLRFGDIERAQRFFEAAYQRLPQYYLAAEHLAETEFLLGRRERARELYLAVIAQTDHPEFHAALAEVEAELGDTDAAEVSLGRAREGYEALLARHPAAFADHAAAFHLEQDEAGRALELARINLNQRRDVMAWLLLAEAEHAAGNRRAACRALDQARRTGLNPPELRELEERLQRCARSGPG